AALLAVHRAKREKVDRSLLQHLPQATEDDSAGDEEVSVSEPKREVGSKPLLVALMISGAIISLLGVLMLVLTSALWLGGQADQVTKEALVAMLIAALASTFIGGAALLLSRSEYRRRQRTGKGIVEKHPIDPDPR